MTKHMHALSEAPFIRVMLRVQLIALTLFIVACNQQSQAEAPELLSFEKDEVWIHLSNDEALLFNVELAITPAQQKQGLMHRTEMADDHGMLFLFDEEKKRSFWMKNTFIPLDMLFLAKDGTIRHIHHSAKPQSLAHLTSRYPSLAVLEINGGYSDALGITEGDRVLHPAFNNTAPQ